MGPPNPLSRDRTRRKRDIYLPENLAAVENPRAVPSACRENIEKKVDGK